MDVDAFVAAHAAEWRRLDELSRRARRPAALSGPELDELVELYQRVATHLSVVRTRSPDPALVDRLTVLVTQSRAAVTGARTSGWQEVAKFLTATFPAAVYARRWWVAATTAGCCAVAVALGVWVASTPRAQSLTTPAQVRELCDAQFAQYYTSSPAGSFAAQVWTNNALVAAGCITFGVLLGLPTLYLLVNNAVNIGVTGGFMATCGKSDQFFTLILPHGMLELTAVFIAGAVGLRLGWRVLVPGARRRTEALASEGRSAVVIALGLVLVLAVSGAVEAFVTPSTLPPGARLTIGAIIEVGFLAYIAVLGRRARAGTRDETRDGTRDGTPDIGDVGPELAGDLVPVSSLPAGPRPGPAGPRPGPAGPRPSPSYGEINTSGLPRSDLRGHVRRRKRTCGDLEVWGRPPPARAGTRDGTRGGTRDGTPDIGDVGPELAGALLVSSGEPAGYSRPAAFSAR